MAGVSSNAAARLFDRWQFCPVTAELNEARSRYERLKLNVPFAELLEHARHLDRSGRLNLTVLGYTRKMVDQVERACRLSLAARALQPKPLYALLRDIRSCCEEFDRLAAEQSANCGLGGKVRHAKNDAVKEQAARLIRSRSPELGWPQPRAAAAAIWPELREFVMAGGFTLTHDIGLIRTIMRWIERIDQVRCAYQETAKSLRSPAA